MPLCSFSRSLVLLLLTGLGLLFPSLIFAQDPSPDVQPEWIQEEDYLYRAYFDFTGQAGGVNDNGQGLLFIPLAQDEESLFFADLRGNIFDDSSAEGNFGLAYRRMVNDQWIAGMCGFYDVRRSQYSNIFRQGSFGFELLSIEWDLRVNGYVPSLKQQRVDSLNTVYLSGNNIATGNGVNGIAFFGEVSGGTFSGNTAAGNQDNGYDFIALIQGGTISNNTAASNSGSGYFVNIFGGGNTATFSGNSAIENTDSGYDVQTGTPQNGVATNTGSGNGSNDTY